MSTAGNVASYDDMVSQSQGVIGNVTTNCCRVVEATLHTGVVSSTESTSNVVTISIDAIPSSGSLQVETSLVSSQTGTHLTALYPATLFFTSTMASPLTTHKLGTRFGRGRVDGLYSLNVTLRGTASHSYRVSYSYASGANALTLIGDGEEPPVPLLPSTSAALT